MHFPAAHFRKMQTFAIGLFPEFFEIVDLSHRDHTEGPQMGSDDQRLGIGVTDDADPLVAGEFGKVRLEL